MTFNFTDLQFAERNYKGGDIDQIVVVNPLCFYFLY